jgi:hypothetical protein
VDHDVLTAIVIDRPRSEVADYVSDPENATAWYQNINEAEMKSPKPLSAGSEIAFRRTNRSSESNHAMPTPQSAERKRRSLLSLGGRRAVVVGALA